MGSFMANQETQREEIVLYHGSLEELNSRGKDKQYKFANKHRFSYDDWSWRRDEEILKQVLAEEGYDGLVNMRTSVRNVFFLPIPFFEGTPIIRIR
jgi:hypothetical protein